MTLRLLMLRMVTVGLIGIVQNDIGSIQTHVSPECVWIFFLGMPFGMISWRGIMNVTFITTRGVNYAKF